MTDSYQPTYWVDNSTPAINAANLRKIEKGVADAHGIVDANLGSTGEVDRITVKDGAGHSLKLPALTTAERDNLTPANGTMIYNVTLGCLQAYRGSAWVDMHAGALRDDLDAGGNLISSLADPVDAQDAATKKYVDDRPAGSTLAGNAYYSGGQWYRTDPLQPAWLIVVDAASDVCAIKRAAAGTGAIVWSEISKVGATGVAARSCVASNEVRYSCGTLTATSPGGALLAKRVPPTPYYSINAGNTMSVRVMFTHGTFHYSYNDTRSKVALYVDSVLVWESNWVYWYESVPVSQDLNVSAGSLIQLMFTGLEGGSGGIGDGVSITDFKIACTDQLLDPAGW